MYYAYGVNLPGEKGVGCEAKQKGRPGTAYIKIVHGTRSIFLTNKITVFVQRKVSAIGFEARRFVNAKGSGNPQNDQRLAMAKGMQSRLIIARREGVAPRECERRRTQSQTGMSRQPVMERGS